jgi:drug/metabolite transporter (DMT)-like permease
MHVSSGEETRNDAADEARRHTVLPPSKETAVKKTLGVILIVLGVFGLAWRGFTYTTQEKVVDIGPIHATRDETHSVPLPPIAGAVALVGGIFLLVAGRKE